MPASSPYWIFPNNNPIKTGRKAAIPALKAFTHGNGFLVIVNACLMIECGVGTLNKGTFILFDCSILALLSEFVSFMKMKKNQLLLQFGSYEKLYMPSCLICAAKGK